MQRAFSAPLIVEEKGPPVMQHDVARLKVPVEEKVVIRAQQEFCQLREIVLQGLLVERHAGKPQEIVFEVVQVPGDRLSVEAVTRITNLVIEVAACLDLKSRQQFDRCPISLEHRGKNLRSGTMVR